MGGGLRTSCQVINIPGRQNRAKIRRIHVVIEDKSSIEGFQREGKGGGKANHLLFTSIAHPSIPSPRLPGAIPSSIPSMPSVPCIQLCDAIPPALARRSGVTSNIGRRNSLMRMLSSMEKWYFSRSTSGSAQCRSRWIFRSSPLRLKISCDHFPDRQSDRGNGPSSSMICAM